MGPSTKACYFCARTGNLTKEHVWPQWMRAVAGDLEPQRYTHAAGFARIGLDSWQEHPTLVVEQPGSVLTARVREVCRDCNSGWMSRLEQATRPHLDLLGQNCYPLGRTTISPEAAALVAVWALKTSWIRELASPGCRTPTASMREHLQRWLTPPAGTAVWAARHSGQLNFDSRTSRATMQHAEHDWSGTDTRDVLVSVLTWGGLSLLSRTDNGPGVPPMRPDPDVWAQLWPVSDSIQWPPVTAASDATVQHVSKTFPWARLPDLPKFVRDSRGVVQTRRN